jgi:hypothetical protein
MRRWGEGRDEGEEGDRGRTMTEERRTKEERKKEAKGGREEEGEEERNKKRKKCGAQPLHLRGA